MSSERTRPNTRLTRTNARFKLGEPTRHDLEFEGPSGGTRRRIMPAPRFWGHGDDVMNKALTVAAIACLGLLNGCMPAPSGGDGDEGDDSVVLIEDEGQGSSGNGSGGNGGGQTGGGGGCGPDAVEAAPPGAPVGCYDLCTGGATCDAGFECRSFNGGALEICLPERNDDPDPDPDPETCPPGQVEANLAEYGEGCYTTCSASDDSACSSDEECSSYQSGAFYCTPRPAGPVPGSLISSERVVIGARWFSTTPDIAGNVWLYYAEGGQDHLDVRFATGAGTFGSATRLSEGDDDSGPGEIVSAYDSDGRVMLGWGWHTSAGSFGAGNLTLGYGHNWAIFGPGADTQLASFDQVRGSSNDFARFRKTYDVALAPGHPGVLVYQGVNDRQLNFETTAGLESTLFDPADDYHELSVQADANGGAHVTYLEYDINGVVYQYVTPRGEGVIGDSLKLHDIDEDPAVVRSAYDPATGSMAVLVTFWNTSFPKLWTMTRSGGGSSGKFDDGRVIEIQRALASFRMMTDLTFSSRFGWVVCGVNLDEEIQCGSIDKPDLLPWTVVGQGFHEPDTDLATRNSGTLQVVATPDGTAHVFWLKLDANGIFNIWRAVLG